MNKFRNDAYEFFRRYAANAIPGIWSKIVRPLGIHAWLQRRHFRTEMLRHPSLKIGIERFEAQWISFKKIPPEHIASAGIPAVVLQYQNWLIDNAAQTGSCWDGYVTARNAKVFLPLGVHAVRARYVIENYCSPGVLSNPKYAIPQVIAPLMKAKRIKEPGYFLFPPWSHNYYHWIVDILPRLEHVFHNAGLSDVPIIVALDAPHFVRQSLELLVPAKRIVALPTGRYWFETLHLPFNRSMPSDVSHACLEFLRGCVLSQARNNQSNPATSGGRRIYISRRDARTRRIINEEALQIMLREYGFECISMMGKTVAEQAILFSEADVIVSPHGAALANLVFARKGAVVVEMFQSGHFNACFYRIASRLQLGYGFVVCKASGFDSVVNLDDLRKVIDYCLAHKT